MRVRKPSRRAGVAAVILAALAGTTSAQVQCAPAKAARDALGSEFGEAPVSRAISGRAVVEMWANPRTRTCTVLITLPDGRACVLAACTDWEALPYREPVAGEDS